ncbi:amino acid adenylation domain-containing protein [Clostridium estertheticum]|uniref:non-ribosomal peptide synthetase n=1 Tax=Clostridium estertheticum TaxID=238834 RepID=UPI001C0D849A|nr:non-ribosomal peptide synthetase [Clostridium estertheticum]MBU3198524.1 amino acid adenylation domain-containing protein [Clostridium estertheticum]WAG64505.1 amino acid adenylation domain-containing protein [Clostridium estertheticum]
MNKIANIIFDSTVAGKISKEVGAELLNELKLEKNKETESIAIIGLSAKLPGSKNIDEFWSNIENSVNCIDSYPENRAKDSKNFVLNFTDLKEDDIEYAKGGYLNEIDKFDCGFFKISPKEASLMDPNQRLFLETAWNAVEDSGYGGNKLINSKTGVFLGYSNAPIYNQYIVKKQPSLHSLSLAGNVSSIIASRISYLLNLTGPSMLIDTACSSSLVAVHLACKSILRGECEQAIAGGVKIDMLPLKGVTDIGIESSDGKTKTFDDSSTGTMWGEGVATIILKPLSKAINDGDNIYAIIKGSAINQDGSSVGITAPNVLAQTKVIIDAWKDARISPESITYIEAHGTGTILGDPIEIDGIKKAFDHYTKRKQFCGIGSVKTNIGHLDCLSGIAGLIKAILALKNKKLPPMINFNKPNSKIDFINSPVYVCNKLEDWNNNGEVRRCGINSFGFSGTNCHMVLEEAPAMKKNTSDNCINIFTISARTKEQLESLISEYNLFVRNNIELDINDICYTANLGRGHYCHRLAMILKDKNDFAMKIDTLFEEGIMVKNNHGIYYGQYTLVSESKPEKDENELSYSDIKKISEVANDKLKKFLDSENKDVDILNSICEAYVKGSEISFNSLYEFNDNKIVRLPVYPFERKRCWLDFKNDICERKDHLSPLLDRCILETENKEVYYTEFYPEKHWVLSDHRVYEKCVIAGTVYLEMAIEACKNHFENKCINLRNIILLSPISVDFGDRRCVQTIINKFDDHIEFIVASKNDLTLKIYIEDDNDWIIHAQGEIILLDSINENKLDIEKIKFKCDKMYHEPDNESYNDLAMMRFGPRWKNIKGMHIGETETLSYLQLPDEYSREVKEYTLHPALMDNALATYIEGDGNSYLPFSYKSIRVYKSLPSKFFSYVRNKDESNNNSEIITYDITITDLFGNIVVEIDGCARKKLHANSLISTKKKDMFHKISWIPSKFEESTIDSSDGYVMVFMNSSTKADEIYSKIKDKGYKTIEVRLGESYKRINENKFFIKGEKEDYEKLIAQVGNLNIFKIVHMFTLSNYLLAKDITSLENKLKISVYSLLYLTREIINNNFQNNIEIVIVSQYVNKVTGEENLIIPENAPFIGLAKVVEQEFVKLKCRSIDVDKETLSDDIVNSILCHESKGIIAYRKGIKYIEELSTVDSEITTNKLVLKENGVYIITGGMGGAGLEIAKFLSLKKNIKIVFINRSKFYERDIWDNVILKNEDIKACEKIKKIELIEQNGTNIYLFNCDISNESTLKELLNNLREENGSIDGIIHCAAVAGNGFLINKNEEVFTNVLRPKIQGTWLLDNLSKDDNLDFFVLFSSGVSITGLLGQGDYTAANSYLDSFSDYRNMQGRKTLTINWTGWKDVGMSVDNNVNVENAILKPMSSSEAISAFEEVLNCGAERVIIGEINYSYEIFNNEELFQIELSDEIKLEINKNKKLKRSNNNENNIVLMGKRDNKYTKVENDVAHIYASILGVDSIDVYGDFYELGGDSLIALKIINDLNERLAIKAEVIDIFKNLTIAKFSKCIEDVYLNKEKGNEDELLVIKNSEDKEYYHLSSGQMRMYVLNQLECDTTSYNIVEVLQIEGNLDVELVNISFKKIIGRHEILRTSFEMIDGEIIQKIYDNIEFKVSCFKAQESEVGDIVKQFIKPFNLRFPPLLRVGIIRVGESKNLLIFDIHHIISDGYSLDVIIKEFTAFYEGREIPKLKIQYRDFIEWQKKILTSPEVKNQEKYWLDIFKGEIPVLSLSTDYLRPTIKDYSGDSYEFVIDNRTTKRLKNLAINNSTTLFTVLLASYNILLSKYSTQEDIIIGVPVVGRSHKDLNELIGMFVNTLAMRNYPKSEKKFNKFLSEVKDNTLKAYENQNYQFEELVSKLDIERNLSRSTLFSAIFNMNNIRSSEIEMKDLKLSYYDYSVNSCTADILFHVIESKYGLKCGIEYQTSLFKNETIKRFVSHFKNILNIILANSNVELSKINLMTSEEEKKIVENFNKVDNIIVEDTTFVKTFENTVANNPNRKAIVFNNNNLTYKELNEKSNQIARLLRNKGITSNSIVGIIIEPSIEMIISILAVVKAGAAYVPIDPQFPLERANYMILDTKVGVILTKANDISKLDYKGIVIYLDDKLLYQGDSSNLNLIRKPNDLMYIIYTSGTTGKPKGVMLESKGVINYANWFINEVNINNKDKTVLVSSFSFDIGYTSIFSSLLGGGELHIMPDDSYKDPDNLLDYIRKEEITYIKSTPSLFSMMVNSYNFSKVMSFNKLRLVVLGGEVIKLGDVKKFNRVYPKVQIMNHYGPTEATIGVCFNMIDFTNYSEVSIIGKPISNTRIYILDKNLNTVPVGIIGGLYISGSGLARGYLNNPELSNEKFIEKTFISQLKERLYKTGDQGKYLEDGSIEFLGRQDSQIKIKGYRIEVGEIEAQLLKCKSIKEVAITLKNQEDGEKTLCAYIVSDENITVEELREYLLEKIPEYMIPSCFIKVENIHLTSNGKIDLKALDRDGKKIEIGVEYVIPMSDVEKELAKTWQEVLGVDKIGLNDNFFALGGDSIKAVQVKAHLKDIKLDLKDLFRYPTILELSKHVYNNVVDIEQDIVIGEVELSPIQRWFFEQKLTDMNHWNQSVMLYKKDCFDVNIIKIVCDKLIEHHDALRIIYKINNKITQINRGLLNDLICVEVIDLTSYNDYSDKVKEESNRIQGSMDLQNGPLVKVTLFKTSEGDHLLFVIHHLIVDGVSWRILMKDFTTAYIQVLEGKDIKLKPKTDSYMKWVKEISLYAKSSEALKEINYWNTLSNNNIAVLKKDYNVSERLFKDNDSVTVTFTKEATNKLLKKVNQTFNAEINDLLIAALGLALKKWIGKNKYLIELEGHGREEIIKDINISRTIGWFSSRFPVIIDMKYCENLLQQIQQVKENLRQIPNKGVGYQILKYMNEDFKNYFLFDDLKSEIVFNYLGQTDDNDTLGLCCISDLEIGENISPNAKRLYALDIIGIISNGILTMRFGYNKKEYKKGTMLYFSDLYKKYLLNIIYFSNETTNKYCNVKSKIFKDINPFNDVYYIDCFYNAFFPIVNYINGSLLPFLANDVLVYSRDKEMQLDTKFITSLTVEKILIDEFNIYTDIKVSVGNIVESIKNAILNHRLVIIHIDCYYESIREDMYNKNHWTHALLVYGYDDEDEVCYVLEHDDINNLNYKPKKISYNDIINCYNGYLTNFQKGEKTPSYFEFYLKNNYLNNSLEKINIKKYQKNYLNCILDNKKVMEESLNKLNKFKLDYINIVNDEEYLRKNIDHIIHQYNNIIKAKKADFYKISKLFNDNQKLLNIQKEVEVSWNYIKIIAEKLKYSGIYKNKIFINSAEKLDKICSLEKESLRELMAMKIK